jgi:hypothetical protein
MVDIPEMDRSPEELIGSLGPVIENLGEAMASIAASAPGSLLEPTLSAENLPATPAMAPAAESISLSVPEVATLAPLLPEAPVAPT